jgi:hypothetical protein
MTVKVHSQIWVCDECMLLHANGDRYDESECDPLSLLEGWDVALGGEHEDDCPNRNEDVRRYGEYDCQCEHREFSTSRCEGCGSTLHGSRNAMTLFKR